MYMYLLTMQHGQRYLTKFPLQWKQQRLSIKISYKWNDAKEPAHCDRYSLSSNLLGIDVYHGLV